MKEKLLLSAIVAGAIVIGLLFGRSDVGRKVLGSVMPSGEYYATSTAAAFANYSLVKTGTGTLGSIIITTLGTSGMCFHDATSTVTNGLWATTTIACFPASATAQTFTFDVTFQKGLLVEFTGSPTGTSKASTTITYR